MTAQMMYPYAICQHDVAGDISGPTYAMLRSNHKKMCSVKNSLSQPACAGMINKPVCNKGNKPVLTVHHKTWSAITSDVHTATVISVSYWMSSKILSPQTATSNQGRQERQIFFKTILLRCDLLTFYCEICFLIF